MGDILGDIIGGAQKVGGQVVNAAQGWVEGAQGAVQDAQQWKEDTARYVQQVDTESFRGNAGRAAESVYNVVTAPVRIPAAVAVMGAGAVAAYIGGEMAKSRAEVPESDGGVTYSHVDEQSGQPMKAGKYAEQRGEVEVSWVEPVSNRPGYKKVADLGLDRKTLSYMSEGYDPLQAVEMRMQEETNPRMLRELDWQRLQLAQNKIELSSDYHHWAKGTGKPQAINPFENEGDAMLALKQGSRQEGKIQLSKSNPGMSDIFADLPGGMGFEDASWEAAKTGFTKKSPSFTKAINKSLATRGDPGIYGTLSNNRQYTEWNKARPNAQVTVISTSELLTGKKQTKKLRALRELEDEYVGFPIGTYKSQKKRVNARDELAMLRETGIMGNSRTPKKAKTAVNQKKSGKKQRYFYGI